MEFTYIRRIAPAKALHEVSEEKAHAAYLQFIKMLHDACIRAEKDLRPVVQKGNKMSAYDLQETLAEAHATLARVTDKLGPLYDRYYDQF